jgi:hypothetical protein
MQDMSVNRPSVSSRIRNTPAEISQTGASGTFICTQYCALLKYS